TIATLPPYATDRVAGSWASPPSRGAAESCECADCYAPSDARLSWGRPDPDHPTPARAPTALPPDTPDDGAAPRRRGGEAPLCDDCALFWARKTPRTVPGAARWREPGRCVDPDPR